VLVTDVAQPELIAVEDSEKEVELPEFIVVAIEEAGVVRVISSKGGMMKRVEGSNMNVL